jgi:hypothetical protein
MKKVKYEIFNSKTGEFERGQINEDEATRIMEVYVNDFEVYESERMIVETIITMQLNSCIHPKLGNLD